MIKIEFFHDVICSFCFPLSYRMRLLQQTHPEIEIVHRSFALVRKPDDFTAMFGSRQQAKPEILHHWQQANQNDDLHRFNISGMQKTAFDFPISMPALIACKAAYLVGGDAAYWDAFDALQQALFVDNRNVEDEQVIVQAMQNVSFDFARWQRHYADPDTLRAVEADFALAEQYAIHSVPCLIINGQAKISGAQPLAVIERALAQFADQTPLTEAGGGVCRLDNGKMTCD